MISPRLIESPQPLELAAFMERCRDLLLAGFSLLNYFATPESLLYMVLGKAGSVELMCCAFPENNTIPSLSNLYPAFSIFERLIYEEFQVYPEGHPWLKAVRNQLPTDASHQDYRFLESESKDLHEVGVGPVHAGVIEPGHFRFICNGEIVEHLEIQLGFQHRAVELMFLEGDIQSKSPLAEAIAGDTAIGHNLAYCLALEALSGTNAAAATVRNIALEMERIAMHLADLSALAADVAYIMGQNLFAALRTTVINSSLAICGSRFGKRWLWPGGVNYGISATEKESLQKTLAKVKAQVINCAEAMFADSSVLSRFDDTGVLSRQAAVDFALTGITAKSSSVAVDARRDYPFYANAGFEPLTQTSGDVFARSYLRYREILQSFELIFQDLESLDTKASILTELKPLQANSIGYGIVEGWRGRILHIAKTDAKGKVIWYKILDPSFTNWQALALAMRGTMISDFPICNKSFDLSYCGSDL